MREKLVALCVRMITYKPAQAIVRKQTMQSQGRAPTRNDSQSQFIIFLKSG